MSSSLGFNTRGEMRPRTPAPVRTVDVVPETAPTSSSMCSVPRGFLPLVAYSGLAAVLPLLLLFANYDFGDDMMRGGFIGAAAVAAGVIAVADDCCVYYNMALFFHAGVEAKIVEQAILFGQRDEASSGEADVSTTSEVLSYVGAGVILAHMLPFFLLDNKHLLKLTAFVGIPVNAAVAVYAAPEDLLLVLASASALLAIVIIVVEKDGYAPSLLTKLRSAVNGASPCFACSV